MGSLYWSKYVGEIFGGELVISAIVSKLEPTSSFTTRTGLILDSILSSY